jgi:hypothetical protein
MQELTVSLIELGMIMALWRGCIAGVRLLSDVEAFE